MEITCHFCHTTTDKVTLSAPATVVTVQTVTTELDLSKDLEKTNITNGWDGARSLNKFRLDSIDEALDNNIEHYALEIDSENCFAYCDHCQCDVTEQWKELTKRGEEDNA